jgi:hypothetical protein
MPPRRLPLQAAARPAKRFDLLHRHRIYMRQEVPMPFRAQQRSDPRPSQTTGNWFSGVGALATLSAEGPRKFAFNEVSH